MKLRPDRLTTVNIPIPDQRGFVQL
jgi:hypothetical protein